MTSGKAVRIRRPRRMKGCPIDGTSCGYDCMFYLTCCSSAKRRTMIIKDVIAHLQTMPQDMEVWTLWHEAGTYQPAHAPQGRVDWIVQRIRRGKTRWEESEEAGHGRSVCVLD